MSIGWMSRAKCKGRVDIDFFPDKGQPATQARRFCADCPVKTQCIEYAVVNNLRDGVWGGTTPMERRTMRRQRGLVG